MLLDLANAAGRGASRDLQLNRRQPEKRLHLKVILDCNDRELLKRLLQLAMACLGAGVITNSRWPKCKTLTAISTTPIRLAKGTQETRFVPA